MTKRLLLMGGVAAAIVAAFFLFWALTWTEWGLFFVAVAFAAVALLLLWVRNRPAAAIAEAP